MDYFFIFEYRLAHQPDSTQTIPPLAYLKYTRINVNLTDSLQSLNKANSVQYQKLDEDITAQKVLFKKTLQQILKSITEAMINFVNVTLVCQDLRFFTEVLVKECQKRELVVPYSFMNFIDLKELLRNQYFCPFKRLADIAEYFEICTAKQAEEKTQTQIIERLLKKLHRDKKLTTTHQRFLKKCHLINKGIDEEDLMVKYKYYKVIGLPFKSVPAEILEILAPQVPEKRRDLCYIYERDRFSGRGIIKIPDDYEKLLLKKNRMYIGARYVEFQVSTEQEYSKAKMRLDQKSSERSPQRRQFGRPTHDNGQRRSRSRSPQYDSRSRERPIGQRQRHHEEIPPFSQSFSSHNPMQGQIHEPQLSEEQPQYGIKVRGLPYSFSEWDVENVFSHHNFIGGSVKLGIKPGTSLKNGQAVVLMRSYGDAQRALDMNGFRCMGRYLEVRVIGTEEYTRYK